MVESSKVYLGDRITVRTLRGWEGNIIGQLPDGRAVLFDKDSSYKGMLKPDQYVECHVIHVNRKYIIANPISEPVDLEVANPETEEGVIDELERLAHEGPWDRAAIARGLLHIIRLQRVIIRRLP